MAEPPPTPREQAVAAVALMLYRANAEDPDLPWPPPYPGEDGFYLTQAEAAAALVWPFAERAALDRAEKALHDEEQAVACVEHPQPLGKPSCPECTRAGGLHRAADLVASLRPEETL